MRFAIAGLACLWLARTAAAQTITEFELPHPNSQPGSIVAGPDGALWFTEGGASAIGRISVRGEIREFSLGGGTPIGIAAGSDGALWFTEQSPARIGRITEAGDVTYFPIPSAAGQPSEIVSGSDGALWFTEVRTTRIGRISTDGTFTEYDVLAHTSYARVGGLVSGPDGALWFSSTEGIGRLTTTGEVTKFSSPVFVPAPITSADGALWYVPCQLFPHQHCELDRMTPAGTATQVSTAGHFFVSSDCVLSPGADFGLWIADPGQNSIFRITPLSVFAEFPIPTEQSRPAGLAPGPDGAMWFTESGANKIARVGEPPSCGADALCLRGSTYEVFATWTAADGGGGVGHAVSLGDESGYFWFFEPGNAEVVVKLLDGCPVNGHSWFFAAGMTNLAVTMTVWDLATGETRTYSSPAGASFAPIIDTAAFGCAPP